MIPNKSLRRVALTGAALFALAACAKKDADRTDTMASGGAIATPTPQPASLQVADVKLGKRLDADKKVVGETDTFAPRDTVFASVHTTGSAIGTDIVARWTFEDGQVVDERTNRISPTGESYTEFHIAKPSGWPEGKYTLHVLVNGQEVQRKDFTVRK